MSKGEFCLHCNQETLQKRSVGIGSWLLVLVTYGLWLGAIYLYPKKCVKCGLDPKQTQGKPVADRNLSVKRIGLALGVVLIVATPTIFKYLPAPKNTNTTKAVAAVTDYRTACGTDGSCYLNNGDFKVYMTVNCSAAIERMAKYDFDWVTWDDWFPKVVWADAEHTILKFSGDSIKLQNGFGAFIPHSYSCQVRTRDASVVSVELEAGRF